MEKEQRRCEHLHAGPRSGQAGMSLLEVLFTVVIVTVGLLGLAGGQTRLTQANLESYQRSQALILLQDMVDRLKLNGPIADCLSFTTDTVNGVPYVGQPAAAGDVNWKNPNALGCGSGTGGTGVAQVDQMAELEVSSWDQALKGAGETMSVTGASSQVGAMLGAKGCVSSQRDANGFLIYKVEVAWQGQGPGFAPASSCAKGQFGADDTQRRVVWTTLQFAQTK